jgi:hypothetical protein
LIESESCFIRKTREPDTAGELVLWTVEMHCCAFTKSFLCATSRNS